MDGQSGWLISAIRSPCGPKRILSKLFTFSLVLSAASMTDAVMFSTPTRQRLSRLPNSPGLVRAWEAGGPGGDAEDVGIDEELLPSVKRNPRRSSDALRAEMKEREAFFITIKKPEVFLDPFMGAGSDDISPDSYGFLAENSKVCRLGGVTFRCIMGEDACVFNVGLTLFTSDRQEWNVHYARLKKIFNKGMLVGKGGCMYPHPRFCSPSEGDKKKAHQRSVAVFTGLVITRLGTKEDVTFNDFGWPDYAELSHICHHHKCCNPEHVQAQPCWRNRKRNYCGHEGECDCGQIPSCLFRYENDSPMELGDLCSTSEEVRGFSSLPT